ncbi:hypothetical protein F511_04751 [Dorcoceras hygrometricum]|uniref:Peptidase S8/S53 domain-containing protein n=1 Tax=Dorcoceras hygrometricum TaxID=472368 RepID=A0A2Z7AXM2_9LAMI|nr:hypothetical protein F511_04751 [Dorcoceras hygrometricum]
MHTTRSWDFMGLTLQDHSGGTPPQLAYGDDVIVGVFDTGIWPESQSFKEEPRMGPIPKHWKGECVAGDEFNPKKHCNRKLIGARYYLNGFEKTFGKINKTENREYISPRDAVGHGTHTASTAVGSRVKNASFYGFARGIARGGAPRARLAVYKVCWNVSHEAKCREEDVLAAFDDALCDGVHVISASIGRRRPPLQEFFASNYDIGSFHAMQLGVSVIFSAGNRGPDPGLVVNANPWSICVASSTMDRTFPTKILLDDDGSRYFSGEGFVRNHISGKLARAIDYFDGGQILSLLLQPSSIYCSPRPFFLRFPSHPAFVFGDLSGAEFPLLSSFVCYPIEKLVFAGGGNAKLLDFEAFEESLCERSAASVSCLGEQFL